MIRTHALLAALAVSLFSACNLQDAIDEANADAEQKARGRAAVEGAIPQVTLQVMTEVSKAMSTALTATTAPRFAAAALRTAATSSGTVNVDADANVQSGGHVKVTGSLAWSIDSDQTQTKITETLSLTANWEGLMINFNNGTLPTNGNETINGSVSVVVANGTYSWGGTYQQKGSLTVNGETSNFDVTVTMTQSGATYTGTVNGEPFSGQLSQPIPNPEGNGGGGGNDGTGSHGTADAAGMSCDMPSQNWCIDYVGTGWTSEAVAAGCSGGGVRVSSCGGTNRIGRCDTNMGANMNAVYNWYGDTSLASQYQSACSGSWSAN